jgi:hypothetical protein
MRDDRGHRRQRWPLISLIVVATLAVAVMVLRFTMLRDQARDITTDEALDRFRQMTTSSVAPIEQALTSSEAPADAPDVPEPGVYRYRTTGEESIDALGGASHRYPEETTITVTPDGCGVLLRWDALRERRDEWRLCATADGIELQPLGLKYHEFFGRPTSEDIVCDRTVLLVPADREPRVPVTQDCRMASDPWFPTWEVLAWDERTVDGTEIDVVHTRMTVVDDDPTYGEQTTIDWWLTPSGLPVQATATKWSVSPSPIGAVTYEEEFTLSLISLRPLQ